MKIINPLKGKTSNGWHFEQNVFTKDSITRAVKAGEGSGNIPKVIEAKDAQPLKRRRTAEERRRRHLHGDKGATFSKGKESYIGNDGVANTVTTVFSKDNIIAEIMYDKTKNEANTREVLCLLRKEIGEEAFLQKMGRLESILKEEVLRQNVYEESICENGKSQPRVLSSTPLFSQDSLLDRGEGDEMRDVRINKECRCASQGWELSEQYTRELDACLSELSYESPQSKEAVCHLRTSCQSPQSMRQALSALEEVRRPESQTLEYLSKKKYRIRKLTARECFRLMDVCESDIDKIQASGVSESQQYRMAGNSIVVACMVGIFKNLFSAEQEELEGQLSLF